MDFIKGVGLIIVAVLGLAALADLVCALLGLPIPFPVI